MKSIYTKQAESFAKKWNVSLEISGDEFKVNKNWGEKDERHCYHCILKRGEKSYKFDFWASFAKPFKEPDLYDVLSCMTKDEPGSYEDFCYELGYDPDEDARRAKLTWRACTNEYEHVRELFGDSNGCWDEFCEIA